jgi:disulfide bond formation protein DsbB
MNSQQQRNWSDIILLLLLPAPITGLVIILGLVYAIASGTTLGGDDEAVEAASPLIPTLSEEVASIATLNAAPERFAPPPPTAAPLDAGAQVEVASALGYDDAFVEAGHLTFQTVCSACHGANAEGIAGLGKPLVGSEFVNTKTDDELLAFVKVGRQPWEPDNTTGVQMPPKGGNPALSDEEILQIIAYIRVLDAAASGTQVAAAGGGTAGTDASLTPSQEFQSPDVNSLVESSGVVIPDTVPQPEHTVESVGAQYCGTRYGTDVVQHADSCLALIELIKTGDLSPNDIANMIVQGNPVWDEVEPLDINIPARGGYPPMTNDDVLKFVEYLYGQADVAYDASTIELPPEPSTAEAEAPTESSQPAASGSSGSIFERDGATVYAALCTEANAALCDALVTTLQSGEMDDEGLFQLLVSGGELGDVTIPARGGNPPLTDSEIRNLIGHLRTLEPSQPAESEPSSETTQPATSGSSGSIFERDGATVYAALCTEVNVALCDALVTALQSGEMDDEGLFQLLVSGGELGDVTIPARGGNPPLTDSEIRNLIGHLHTLAE